MNKEKATKIIALGDLHGAYDEFIHIAKAFQLVNDELHWIASDVQFVQLGDVCDRGYDCFSIYKLLMQWQKEAPHYNSAVHFVIGNHEVMNIYGIYHYNTTEEYKSFAKDDNDDGKAEFIKAFKKGGWLLEWIKQQNIALQIDDFIFAHADFPSNFQNKTLKEINSHPLQILENAEVGPGSKLPEPLFSEENSILWCRIAHYKPSDDYQDALFNFLNRHQAKLYICGHSVTKNFLKGFEGRFLCIDSGISPFYNGSGEVLLIQREQAYACTVNKKSEIKRKALIASNIVFSFIITTTSS